MNVSRVTNNNELNGIATNVASISWFRVIIELLS